MWSDKNTQTYLRAGEPGQVPHYDAGTQAYAVAKCPAGTSGHHCASGMAHLPRAWLNAKQAQGVRLGAGWVVWAPLAPSLFLWMTRLANGRKGKCRLSNKLHPECRTCLQINSAYNFYSGQLPASHLCNIIKKKEKKRSDWIHLGPMHLLKYGIWLNKTWS